MSWRKNALHLILGGAALGSPAGLVLATVERLVAALVERPEFGIRRLGHVTETAR